MLAYPRLVAESCSFSPCHITGFYHKIFDHSSALRTGSVGAGVSISQGVTTTVRVYEDVPHTSYDIAINGITTDNARVSRKVLDQYLPLLKGPRHFSINHEIKVPIGFGLGSSGAAALSLSYALNQALAISYSPLECAQIAHCAELSCKTGLGTVCSEFIGGLEIRTTAGAPGIGRIEKLSLRNTSVIAICLAALPTSLYIDLHDDNSTEKAKKFSSYLLQTFTTDNFLRLSFEFANGLGIINRTCKSVIKLLQSKGFLASIALFGQTVFTIIPDNEVETALKVVEQYLPYLLVSSVDNSGAKLLKISQIG